MKKNNGHHFYIDGAFSVLKSIIFDVVPIEGEKSSILSTRTRIEGTILSYIIEVGLILSTRTRIEVKI